MGEGTVFNRTLLNVDTAAQIVGEGAVQQVGVGQEVAAAEAGIAVVAVLYGEAVEQAFTIAEVNGAFVRLGFAVAARKLEGETSRQGTAS